MQLILQAFDIGLGDEVILPDLTFAASINAVINVGATPVISDVNLDTWNQDPKAVEKCINEKTKAILTVHLLGLPSDVRRLNKIAKNNNLLLIEDAAEALGACVAGQAVGTLGDAAAFSFFGNKTITTGEGGACVLKNLKLQIEREYFGIMAWIPKKGTGTSWLAIISDLQTLQASLGLAQLDRFNEIFDAKRKVFENYRRALDSRPSQKAQPDHTHGNWLYGLMFNSKQERKIVGMKLAEAGYETRNMFYPLHKQPPYVNFCGAVQPDISVKVSSRVLLLPSSSTLKADDQDEIIEIILKNLIN